ncbi:MAG TPA: hypothetical protein VF789_04155 [Thermoanaerobaculia bacterium]
MMSLMRPASTLLVFVAALLSGLASALAQAPTTVKVDVVAKELPEGAKLRVEMTAEFSFFEYCRPKKGESICYPETAYSVPGQGKLVWDFRVTANQSVGKTSYTFTLPQNLKKPPSNLGTSITLPTIVRLEVPGSKDQPGQILDFGESRFGFAPGKTASYYWCLRVVGPPKRFRVGIAKSCDAPYKPGIGIPASRMPGSKP